MDCERELGRKRDDKREQETMSYREPDIKRTKDGESKNREERTTGRSKD